MFVDANLQLCSAQQVTADAASENTLDLGNVTPKRHIGDGEPMVVSVSITAAGTNSGTADIQVIESANADLSSPTVLAIRRLATADLAAGKVHLANVPKGKPNARYFGIYFDITGTVDFTVDAYVMPASMAAPEKPESYADAITIS
jgi:hypothetical protein